LRGQESKRYAPSMQDKMCARTQVRIGLCLGIGIYKLREFCMTMVYKEGSNLYIVTVQWSLSSLELSLEGRLVELSTIQHMGFKVWSESLGRYNSIVKFLVLWWFERHN